MRIKYKINKFIKTNFNYFIRRLNNINNYKLIFGDWGLGIGDWAQSPIPNPQSPPLKIN